MNDLKKRMRAIQARLLKAGRQFARSGSDARIPPRQALRELQQHLDYLRQAIWDARKLCDPGLAPYRSDSEHPGTRTLAERVVDAIDEWKRVA